MKLLRVRQNLVSHPIADVPAAVHAALDGLRLEVPRGDVGITAGSRGIANIAAITKAAGDWLRGHGARPFLFPSMGSHNGGTAEGQRAMIESLGLTEQAMGMPIRASMDVVKLGTVPTGDVWMDRLAHESAGVLVLNRIKLHTCFAGPEQSGLTKMMVVGMGKTPSAQTFHSAPTPAMPDMLHQMRRVVLDSGRIWAGLAILEDGFDQTAELHALQAADIPEGEAPLLERIALLFPPAAAGRDQRAGGRRDRQDLQRHRHGPQRHRPPRRGRSARHPQADHPGDRRPALAASSHGNAIGVGLADFITRQLRDAIDEQKTFLNTFTTGHMGRSKIPLPLADDQELITKLAERYGHKRWLFIPNTLHLETLYASVDLKDELTAHPLCTVDPQPVELRFKNGRQQLVFNGE